MPLPIKNDKELVDSMVAAMQAASTAILDFNIGAIFRAFIESNMANSLWLQAEITYVLAITRLSTSHGIDVDTFVGDFGLTRTPAGPAGGDVTFARFTPSEQALIPLGTLVSSVVTGVAYAVELDTGNPSWSPSLNAYVLPVSIPSISVPVKATTAGIVGNCLANQITTIRGVLVGVDTVTNPLPFTTGKDQQTDDELKAEFVLYLASLSRAVKQALQFAITRVPGVARYKLQENKTLLNADQPGFFYAVIDDGTGNASPELLGNVGTSLEAYRGYTITYAVYAPVPITVGVTAHVFTDGSVEDSVISAQVVSAIQNFILAQSFDSLFAYSRVPSIIYGANSTIIDVTNYTLNGGTSDIQLIGAQIMLPGTITIVMNA
jgi:uncharacterized phage protein gp47/JayE